MLLLLPEIDEDGRTDFWRGLAEELTVTSVDAHGSPTAPLRRLVGGVRIELLSGVGNDVTRDWEEFIRLLCSDAPQSVEGLYRPPATAENSWSG